MAGVVAGRLVSLFAPSPLWFALPVGIVAVCALILGVALWRRSLARHVARERDLQKQRQVQGEPARAQAAAGGAAPLPARAGANTDSGTRRSEQRIFVSHSSSDDAVGRQLVSDLRNALGADDAVWYDASGGLQGGDVWWDRIVAELTARDVFIVLLSPDAVRSQWVRDEVLLAWKQKNTAAGKVMIPILLGPCEVPEYLTTIQYVSFVPPRPYHEALAQLLAAIREGKTRETQLLADSPVSPVGPPADEWLLPAPDHFVGREEDLAWVTHRLGEGREVAAITALGGMGGIGKTALASVAVRHLSAEGRFPDGIAVVLCQDITDPAEILRRVLTSFDPYRRTPMETEQTDLSRKAATVLRGKDALVVMDNVEPGLAVADVLAPLRSAGLAVLLTARHALPRAAVPLEASRQLELLAEDQALDLFTHALGRGSSDALNTSEHVAAVRLVDALGRHTLAVKLAGAYAADVGRDVGTLAAELEHPEHAIDLPDGEIPHAVGVVFARSTQSLPEEARRLFAALAEFATPEFGREAVLALGKGLGYAAPANSLNVLILRALVEPSVNEAMPAGSDRERLRLHPLLRAFATQLAGRLDSKQRDAADEAIARHYATYANAHPSQYAALGVDEGNLSGALAWTSTHERSALLVELCLGMHRYWRERWKSRESLRYLPEAISILESADHRMPTVVAGGQAFAAADLALSYGIAQIRAGALDDAQATLLRNLAARQTLGDRKGEGEALENLGEVAQLRGHLDEAEGYFRQALALAQEVGDRRREGTSAIYLGGNAFLRGRRDEAEGYFRQALALAREMGDRPGEAKALGSLGLVAAMASRLEDAEELTREGIAIYRELDDRQGEGQSLSTLGLIAFQRGALEVSANAFRQSLAIRREVYDPQGELVCLSNLGNVDLLLGQLSAARLSFTDALAIAREMRERRGEGIILTGLGAVALAEGRPDEADEFLREGLAISREVQNRPGEGAALTRMGQVALDRGQLDDADAYLSQAAEIRQDVREWKGLAKTLCVHAQLAEVRGDVNQAEMLLRKSLELAREADGGPEIAEASLALGRLLVEQPGQPEAREEASELVADAVRRYEAMGMAGQEREARNIADALNR